MPQRPKSDGADLLHPGVAAALAGVSPKTLHRYGTAGRVDFVTLPSGHRRYLRPSVEAIHEVAAA